MKHSSLSSIRTIGYFVVISLSVSCQKETTSTTFQSQPIRQSLTASTVMSQTKTASFLNNLNNFREVFGNQNYPNALAKDLQADDGICGCTSNLIAMRDSTSTFTGNSVSSLSLQGFGFTIPDNANIINITITLRRFKTGRASVGDQILSVMQRYECGAGTPCRYGVFWTLQDTYAGKIYPGTETAYVFSQSGSGNNGGFSHNQPYKWTPAMVNHQYFGVRIDNFPPIGKGSVQICYDQVQVTVQYS